MLVIGVTGVARALTELSAVHQIWSTSYGRALIAKTVLFIPLLGLGWLNRTLLLGVFARLRRSALVEITMHLRDRDRGRRADRAPPRTRRVARARRRPAPQLAQPPVLPPLDAVVDARELGTLAVAVARTPGSATITLLGSDGTGVSGRTVLVDGIRAVGVRRRLLPRTGAGRAAPRDGDRPHAHVPPCRPARPTRARSYAA